MDETRAQNGAGDPGRAGLGAGVTAGAVELDEALDRLQQGGLEYGGGLSNHGPMAVEALMRLGHRALVPAFVDRYAPRLGSPPQVGTPIPPAARAAALGEMARHSDWLATFLAELEVADWRSVLRSALPPLIEGLFGGATHGLLRTAHAVRALEDEETPVRRRELAFGLGYWAACFQSLPGDPPPVGGGAPCDPARVLEAVPALPEARRVPGLFTESVRRLDPASGFAAALAEARAPSDPEVLGGWVGALCAAGARLYLANPRARIAYVHCVTAPSALRAVAPYLGSEERAHAGFRALQAVAALHAVSSAAVPGAPDAESERLATDVAEIRYRAACSLEEHAIKLAAACLDESVRAGSGAEPALRLAAADAALHLQSGGEPAC